MFESFEFNTAVFENSFLPRYGAASRVHTLKLEALYAFETSGLYYPMTPCHIRRMELLYAYEFTDLT
jgi:hypothetical protein